jgi:hypothetical protein
MLHRQSAFLIHLTISAFVLAVFTAWVFTSLYPPPLLHLQGGGKVLAMLAFVDVVLGPMMTLIVYKPGKKSLVFDMAVILTIQLAALVYGTHVIYSQRPAFLAFTYDRFVVVSAADLLGGNVPADIANQSPWRGNIRLVWVKLPWMLEVSNGGLDLDSHAFLTLASVPGSYQPFPPSLEALTNRALPENGNDKDRNTASQVMPMRFPVVGRAANGTAFLSPAHGALLEIRN